MSYASSYATESLKTITQNIFNKADKQALQARDDLASLKNDTSVFTAAIQEKMSAIYGPAIADVIRYAMENELDQNTTIDALHNNLLKRFNVKKTKKAVSDEALKLIGEQFTLFENNSNDYSKSISQILLKTKQIYNTDQDTREQILYAFEEYIRILIREHNAIQKVFRTKTIPNAVKQILTEELKNKNQVENRLIISLLINTIIDQAGAIPPKEFDKNAKNITQDVINWFSEPNMESISTVIQEKLSKEYEPQKLYVILTSLKHFLDFAIEPKKLPEATAWTPPARTCPWYDLSCSIPWSKIGDGLKDVFEDKVGGALKTAFVNNVYEKGLKKFGEEVKKEFTVCMDVKELKAKRYYKIALRETIFSSALTDFSVDFGKQASIQPLIGARKVAEGTLDTAKGFLDKVANPISTGTIGAAEKTGTGVLTAGETVATGVLTGVDETVQALLSTFDIKHMRYEGSLQELASGNLGHVVCTAVIVGKSVDFSFDLDIHGPIKSIEKLADKIKNAFVAELKKAIVKLQDTSRSLGLSFNEFKHEDMVHLTLWKHSKNYASLSV